MPAAVCLIFRAVSSDIRSLVSHASITDGSNLCTLKGAIHIRYLGSIRKLKPMTAGSYQKKRNALLFPSTPPWARERFHCIRGTPLQPECECKSKTPSTPLKGPLFIRSIIICRLGTEGLRITTGNWYTQCCLHVSTNVWWCAHTGSGAWNHHTCTKTIW